MLWNTVTVLSVHVFKKSKHVTPSSICTATLFNFFLYPIYIFTNFHSFLFCRYIHRFDFHYYKYKYLGGAAATACPALISRIVSLTLFIICKQQKNCDCGSVFFLLFHSDPSIKNAQFHVDSFLVFIIGYHK